MKMKYYKPRNYDPFVYGTYKMKYGSPNTRLAALSSDNSIQQFI